jgi:hypothetical protein
MVFEGVCWHAPTVAESRSPEGSEHHVSRRPIQRLADVRRAERLNEWNDPMKRRTILALALLAPLSIAAISRSEFGRRLLQRNGWILKPEDL